jgi:hypothetical protein
MPVKISVDLGGLYSSPPLSPESLRADPIAQIHTWQSSQFQTVELKDVLLLQGALLRRINYYDKHIVRINDSLYYHLYYH